VQVGPLAVKDVMTSDDRHFAPFRDEDHVVRRREAHKAWLDVRLSALSLSPARTRARSRLSGAARTCDAKARLVDRFQPSVASSERLEQLLLLTVRIRRQVLRDGQAELFGIVARRPLARCGRTNCRRPVNLQDAVSLRVPVGRDHVELLQVVTVRIR
jgi:hypothetical protein